MPLTNEDKELRELWEKTDSWEDFKVIIKQREERLVLEALLKELQAMKDKFHTRSWDDRIADLTEQLNPKEK